MQNQWGMGMGMEMEMEKAKVKTGKEWGRSWPTGEPQAANVSK